MAYIFSTKSYVKGVAIATIFAGLAYGTPKQGAQNQDFPAQLGAQLLENHGYTNIIGGQKSTLYTCGHFPARTYAAADPYTGLPVKRTVCYDASNNRPYITPALSALTP